MDAAARLEVPRVLAELDILLVDCQATAPTLDKGHLLEIAWQRVRGGAPGPLESFRVALPEGGTIPRQVSRITGIVAEDLIDAPSLGEVSIALRRAMDGVELLVAHWARYERSFVEAMVPDHGVPWLCTHALAKQAFPGLPRKGIRAVAGYLGDPMHEVKRAAEHVEATHFIWSKLVDHVSESADVQDLRGLRAYLERPVTRAPREYPLERDVRLGLPEVPGVYRMLGRDGSVLYVGKATSLKSRVNSYYRGKKGQGSSKLELVTQVHALDVTPTETPLEAAILEADEIKRHAPAYNTVLRRRARRVIWASELDLRDTRRVRSEHYVLGPIASPRMWSHMAELPAILGGVRPSDEAWTAQIDAAVFSEGVRLFAAAHDSDLELCDLLALGEELLAARLGDDAPEDEEDEVTPSEGEWTPEGVMELLEWNAIGLHRTLSRGAWIERLHDAVVDFEHGDGFRRLRVGGGHLIETMTVSRRSDVNVRAGVGSDRLSLETFDRLNVLLTEVRRLVKGEPEVYVTTADRAWEPDELRAAFSKF